MPHPLLALGSRLAMMLNDPHLAELYAGLPLGLCVPRDVPADVVPGIRD